MKRFKICKELIDKPSSGRDNGFACTLTTEKEGMETGRAFDRDRVFHRYVDALRKDL